jgi:hypothetical protein
MTAAEKLFTEITREFPPPWTVEYHVPQHPHAVSRVVASNGGYPITMETFTGDGDMFNLGSEGAEALAEFVNAMQNTP